MLFYLLGVVSSPAAMVLDPEVQTALQAAGAAESLSVIVTFSNRIDAGQFRTGPRAVRRTGLVRSLRSRAAQNQQDALRLLAGRRTGRIHSLWLINGLAVSASRDTIQALAALPRVERIRLNRTFSLPAALPASSAAPEWNLGEIKADKLWALGHAGQGIVVATMDSGVDLDHPDLVDRWRGGTNSWYDPYGKHALPVDPAGSPDNGHGTGVMGILVGGDAGGSAIGVAPGAKWIAVKIFDDNGTSDLAKVHLGF
jgi:serine protease AprX